MAYTGLSDDAWRRVRACLEEHTGLYVKQEAPTRRFVEAVLWMACAGAPWRMLPAEFGPWNSVYKRFARWQEKGVRQRLMDQRAADGDLKWVMLDSTLVRAHGCAAGAKKSEGDQCLGRSRGGFSTKLHGLADSLGNPFRFALTAGQAGDAPVALALLGTVAMIAVQAALGDRADDSDAILAWVTAQGAVPVIPPHPGRTAPRPTDWYR